MESQRRPATPSEDVVLRAIAHAGGLTRAELARTTGLPRSTVTWAVRRLAADGRIVEGESRSSGGGPRSRVLTAATSDTVVAVAEMGTQHIRVGFMESDGSLQAVREDAVGDPSQPDALLAQIAALWAAVRRDDVGGRQWLAGGLAIPGPVDGAGCVRSSARLPNWNGISLGAQLAAETGMPITVMNDARAAAWGEWVKRGRPDGTWLYVKAGTGIGASLIVEGKPYVGAQSVAGEITHTRVRGHESRSCSCGNTGCLEVVASGAALRARLAERGIHVDSASELLTAATNGDTDVISLVRESGGHVGEALSGIVNFLNPTGLVVGGSLSAIGAFLAGVRGELYDRCLPMVSEHLVIDQSLAGPDAALLGVGLRAATLTHDHQKEFTS